AVDCRLATVRAFQPKSGMSTFRGAALWYEPRRSQVLRAWPAASFPAEHLLRCLAGQALATIDDKALARYETCLRRREEGDCTGHLLGCSRAARRLFRRESIDPRSLAIRPSITSITPSPAGESVTK